MHTVYEIKRQIRVLGLVTAYKCFYPENFFFPGEEHPFWELVYVEKGQSDVTADDRVYTLSPGEVVFHRPGEFHRLWSAAHSCPQMLILSFTADGEALTELEQTVRRPGMSAQRTLKALEEALHAHTVLPVDAVGQFDLLTPCCKSAEELHLIANLLELFLVQTVREGETVAGADTPGARNYHTIVRQLQKQVDRQLTLEELARQCSMSVPSMKKTFARYADCSIHRYFLRLKILHAKSLLMQGAAVYEAAQAIGITDPNYFSAMFRRETGQTPTSFRQSEASRI